jgi:hypothetical protein
MNTLLVQMCYKDIQMKSNKPDEKNFSAICKYCPNKKVSGNKSTSSNFYDHIKVCMPLCELLCIIKKKLTFVLNKYNTILL